MVDVLIPATWRRSSAARWTLEAGLVLTGSVVMALSARLEYVLPFTLVPFTAQTLALLLLGAALGPRRGGLAMLAYLAEGAVGLPVFALGGGAAYLLAPTAGYLWSYPLVAWIVGTLARKGWDRGPVKAALAMFVGNCVVYAVALPWLAAFVGRDEVLMAGLIPFIPGDLIKVGLAALLLPAAWAVIGRLQSWAGPSDD